jgi:hypothetical protein
MSNRLKKILAGVGVLAALGLGGAAIAAAQSESEPNDHGTEHGKATETEQNATGPDATRAGQAALQAVGGGKVLSVEKKTPEQGAEKSDSGESAKERAIDQKTVYAVQVQKTDGKTVDVALDGAFSVLDTQQD